MASYYCPRCGPKTIVGVYWKQINTPASGPFIVGHISGNPHLPLVGGQIYGGTTRLGYFCKACGEEVREILTPEEKRERERHEKKMKNERDKSWGFIFLVLLIIIILTLWACNS